MRRMACSGGSLKNGGSPSTISITIMPRDQMSTLEDSNKLSSMDVQVVWTYRWYGCTGGMDVQVVWMYR